uniref:Uncharacterized protein n=1 Tax=Arundo donax TaxID=35708 RepID=A0A0A9GMK4_ARUDO
MNPQNHGLRCIRREGKHGTEDWRNGLNFFKKGQRGIWLHLQYLHQLL